MANTHAHTQMCWSATCRDVSIYLNLWSRPWLDFCNFVPSDTQHSSREGYTVIFFIEALLWPCGLIRSFSLCDTVIPRTKFWPTKLRHHGKLWAECEKFARQKHSWGRQKPKQWKEEEIHLFSKRKVHKASIVYCCVHVHMLAVAETSWLCYAKWTR